MESYLQRLCFRVRPEGSLEPCGNNRHEVCRPLSCLHFVLVEHEGEVKCCWMMSMWWELRKIDVWAYVWWVKWTSELSRCVRQVSQVMGSLSPMLTFNMCGWYRLDHATFVMVSVFLNFSSHSLDRLFETYIP